MENVAYDANYDLPPGFPGLIYDSMFTDKVTVPAGNFNHKFGTAVGIVPATGVSVLPVGTTPVGIAIHDHNKSGGYVTQDGYVQYDAMAVMSRGRIWAAAGGACTKEGPARYDPATGVFSDAGTAIFPGARFKSSAVTVVGIMPGDAAQSIVIVELGHPTIGAPVPA
jgi:hypothetical protein